MRILGLPLLEHFKINNANSRGQLEAWQNDVAREKWKTGQDIKRRYKDVDFLDDSHVIFKLKGNSYHLVVQVRYLFGLVVIQWVGTYAEHNETSSNAD